MCSLTVIEKECSKALQVALESNETIATSNEWEVHTSSFAARPCSSEIKSSVILSRLLDLTAAMFAKAQSSSARLAFSI